jgi:hypothetical protein
MVRPANIFVHKNENIFFLEWREQDSIFIHSFVTCECQWISYKQEAFSSVCKYKEVSFISISPFEDRSKDRNDNIILKIKQSSL